jgi:hypothetical protein
MLQNEYKILHESFMKNNNGTTAFDSFLYIIPSSFAIFHAIIITSALRLNSNNNVPIRFFVEFITICITLVLTCTVLSNFIGHIVLTLFLITITSVIRQLQGKCHLTPFVQIPSILPDFITGTYKIQFSHESFIHCSISHSINYLYLLNNLNYSRTINNQPNHCRMHFSCGFSMFSPEIS